MLFNKRTGVILVALVLLLLHDRLGAPAIDPQIKLVVALWLGVLLLLQLRRHVNLRDPLTVLPKPYTAENQRREDYYASSGLNHNFSETYYDIGVDRIGAENAEKLADMIEASKLKTIVSQQNVVVPRSPHCHVGKDRGYLNWN